MLIQFGQALGDYLYDVFVAKFDFWLAFGLVAQLLFTARFLVQWISSERAGRSVIPMAFWFFSMGGGLMTLVYGIAKREPVIKPARAVRARVPGGRNWMRSRRSSAHAPAVPPTIEAHDGAGDERDQEIDAHGDADDFNRLPGLAQRRSREYRDQVWIPDGDRQ